MTQQAAVRAVSYSGLQDYMRCSVQDANVRVEKIVMLPSTFREFPLFRYRKYMDALAGMRVFGTYDLFVTFTYNP